MSQPQGQVTVEFLLAMIGDREVQIHQLKHELAKARAALAEKEKAHGDAA